MAKATVKRWRVGLPGDIYQTMDDYGCHCGIYIFVSVRHKEKKKEI